MVPYGGPIYKPPVQRVDPPSHREVRENRRLLLLVVLFFVACCLLLTQGDSPAGLWPGGLAFAVWYAVKKFWKI